MTSLGVEYGAKYTLTGPDGTIAVFNDSTDPNFVGILSPESSGLDSPDVREDGTDAVEEDGGHHGDFFEGRRPVVLQGTIIASSKLQRNERVARLKRASRALRKDATLVWLPEGGAEVELKLRRQQPLRITKGYVKEFQLPMVCASAFVSGTTVHTASVTSGSTGNTAGLGEAEAGTHPFETPNNIAGVTDKVYSMIAMSGLGTLSTYLFATKFGLSVPSNARPIGGKVEITRDGEGGGIKSIITSAMEFVYKKAGRGGAKTGEGWTKLAAEVFGKETDTWSGAITGLTPTIVNDTTFGFRLRVKNNDTETGTGRVDSAFIKIWYTNPLKAKNEGDAPAPPTITVTNGKLGLLKLIHVQSGKQLVLSGAWNSTDTLVIDFEHHTIKLNGINAYNLLQFSESEWFSLEPGENTIEWYVEGLENTTTNLKIEWRDTYI